MDHIPTPPGESSENPESEYGELRSGRPEAGIRFPRDPDEEPHRKGEASRRDREDARSARDARDGDDPAQET